jgi:DHA1 family tetracycline resistance protein-like MFS transporter
MTQSPGKERKAAIAFILVTLFIDILGIGIIVPVLPELVKELVEVDSPGLIAEGAAGSRTEGATENLSAAENFARAGKYVGVISATYALMQFLFAPIMGALSDRFGRRPVILVSLFGLGIDFIIQGFAPSIWWLFIGRVLAGIMGASFTTANAYIADVSTDDTRARNFGFVGMMFGLGFTIGPALGGFLGDYSLRLPFFVAAGLALVNCLYGYFVLPESLPREKRSAFSLRNANPFGTLRRIRMYPMVAGLAAVFACKSLAQRGLENVWVLYTGFRYEWDASMNGWALGLVGIMAVVVQGGLVRPTVRRLGERRTVIIGTVVGAFSFLGYGLATQGWMIPGIIVFGAFGGVSGPAIQSLVTSRVDESEQGKIQGALTSLTSLTNIIAPILFNTFLFSYFISDDAPFLLPGAPFFVGFVLLLLSIVIAIRVFRKFPGTATD